jgi:hypothetical protein
MRALHGQSPYLWSRQQTLNGFGFPYPAPAALVLGCLWCWRQKRDRELFTLAVVLTVVASPRVDNHYFALLIVSLAMARPHLSRVWLVPFAFWLCPATGLAGWQVAVAWATVLVLTYCLLRDEEPREEGDGSLRLPHSEHRRRLAGRQSAGMLDC